ncbi:MAG: aspartyl-trna synthetase, partial [Pseudomonadota bacterium]
MLRQFLFTALCAFLAASTSLADVTRGPVTNLPMPRFVSLKSSEGNVRRGPSLSHRIDWVYTRRNLPLKVCIKWAR